MRIPLLVAFSAILCATPASLAQSQPSAPSSQTKQLTPESFLELRGVQDPQFSPDGTRIAFVVSDPLKGEKRTQHIWVYDVPSDRLRARFIQLGTMLHAESNAHFADVDIPDLLVDPMFRHGLF